MWREHLGCEADSRPVDEGWNADCESWACGEHEVRLCLHPGGHSKPRGWIDRMIEPHRTRAELTDELQIAAAAPVTGEFRTGVLQT